MKLKVGDLLCVWDLETTGLSSKTEEVVEYAHKLYEVADGQDGCVKIQEVEDGEYVSLAETKKVIPRSAWKIHGIRTTQGEPSLLEVCDRALDHIKAFKKETSNVFLVGHNTDVYDIRLLSNNLMREHSVDWKERLREVGVVGTVDTLRLLRPKRKRDGVTTSNKLSDLYAALGEGPLPSSHRAMGDVRGIGMLMMHANSPLLPLMFDAAGVAFSIANPL
jgi:DNA polymerase III alpha subunit (gram-positive type)